VTLAQSRIDLVSTVMLEHTILIKRKGRNKRTVELNLLAPCVRITELRAAAGVKAVDFCLSVRASMIASVAVGCCLCGI